MFPLGKMDAVKRVLAGLFLLAVSAAGVYGYSLSERERAYRQLLADGDTALARDNTAAAIEAFSGAITLKDDAMVGYLKRGLTYRRRGEFVAAIRDLRRAADIDPGATRALEELGDAYLADTPHRYNSAAERYEAYVRLDNRVPRVLYKLAFARYNERHFTAAIDALQRAIALDDNFAEAYYLLGLCQRDAQHPDEARQALEKALKLQPAMLHAREELADLYGAQGRSEARLAQLEALTALDRGPSREIALGLAYARAGQHDNAISTLSHAAERYPDHPYAYVALGRTWLELAQARGDGVALRKAVTALQEAVGNDDSSEALTLFGRALLLTNDAEAAERMLQDATEKKPVDAVAFAYLADAAERLNHYAVARQALLDYDALRGDEPDERKHVAHTTRLGDLSAKLDDMPSAAAYFLRAAQGTDPALLARAADAQLRAGSIDAAWDTAAKSLDKDPANELALSVQKRIARGRS
jgi:tetratricopeptide (TPR) repeat protein